MATFSKITLSGSTDGRGIKVAATASAGTTIHTASSTATTYDEIWLYVQNTSASSVKLTVQWGGTTSPDDDIEVTVAAEAGLMLVAPGLVLKGNASPLVVRAFAATANVLTIHGYVNRITA
jgi:hypothetical protein